MPVVNCSVYVCGTCGTTKRILSVPLAFKDDAHRRWCDGWLGEIKKLREMDNGLRGQINDDKIYTCEKHFDPEEI